MSGREVWKLPLSLDPLVVQFTQVHRLPVGARFVHGAAQQPADGLGSLALWYEVDTDAPLEDRHYQIFGTGNGPIGDHLTYVATGLFASGSLVLHAYEVTGTPK